MFGQVMAEHLNTALTVEASSYHRHSAGRAAVPRCACAAVLVTAGLHCLLVQRKLAAHIARAKRYNTVLDVHSSALTGLCTLPWLNDVGAGPGLSNHNHWGAHCQGGRWPGHEQVGACSGLVTT